MTKDYEKRMTDAYGDTFILRANEGHVKLVDANPYRDSAVDMIFTPDDALRLARRLIKAATIAYEQESDAAGLL